MPSTLVIESLNAVATRTARAYLYGVQDDLLDFRGWARTDSGAMSGKIPSSLGAVSMVRNSRENVGPTCGPTEAVHCTRSERVRGRESERGPLTLPSSEAGGSIQADSPDHPATPAQFSRYKVSASSPSPNNPSPSIMATRTQSSNENSPLNLDERVYQPQASNSKTAAISESSPNSQTVTASARCRAAQIFTRLLSPSSATSFPSFTPPSVERGLLAD